MFLHRTDAQNGFLLKLYFSELLEDILQLKSELFLKFSELI